MISSGAVTAHGDVKDETFENEDVVAIRRGLPFLRGRETIAIMTNAAERDQLMVLAELYQQEPSGMDWALHEVGLPSVAEITA